MQPSSTMQGLSVSISVPSGYTAAFYGISQFGSGRSQCDVYNQNGRVNTTAPIPITAANLLTINCVRQMQTVGNNLIADAQDLVFMTSKSNLTVPMAAIGNLSRMTADQIKAQVKAEVDASTRSLVNQALVKPNQLIRGLQDNLNALSGRVGIAFNWKIGNNGTASCSTYCRGSNWGGWSGDCVIGTVGNQRTLVSCDAVVGYPNSISCLCAAPSGWPK